MEALVDDAEALAIGLFVSIGVCLAFCMLSVWLISWSALRQVIFNIILHVDIIYTITLEIKKTVE